MTRRPQKPAVAQRATSSPSSIRPPLLLHFRTYTTPPQIHTNPIRRSPYSTPHHRNTTAYSSHQPHTQHIPHNGPSKGVPRDAARVRQGRPPVHHQVQQAYVFTLFLFAKRMKEKDSEGSLYSLVVKHLLHSRQIAMSQPCSSSSSPTSTPARIGPRHDYIQFPLTFLFLYSRQARVPAHFPGRWHGLLDHGSYWLHCQAE